ncbi:MAG TPA: YggS family pyridoxal phosphate-dependent enzyme [Nitrospiria bacterium]|nr:YggS family pyridoxal phosphate-dependent enzyme [Nitrospiria bacterium]
MKRVRERIDLAARRVGRAPEAVRLVAVTKGVDVDRIRRIAGEPVLLGESRVQEAVAKQEALARFDDLKGKIVWHMIGHLQRNKVKEVVGRFEMIHSVDSISLAREIDRQAGHEEIHQQVLLEVNLAGETSKHGFSPKEVGEALGEIRGFENLQVEGLMTIPPLPKKPEDSRPYFRRLREMAERLGVSELSMGMSGDFEVAVEEGATLVRVGTAIFGERG